MKWKLFTGALLLAGCLLVGATFFPTHYQETKISLDNLQGDTTAIFQDGRKVILILPDDLSSGEAVMFQMELRAGPTARASTYNLLEGRLDLPGVQVFPAATVTAPFHPNQPVSFRWLVTAGDVSPLPGRLWLTLIANDGTRETRTPVLAHPVNLEVRQLLGMTLPMARWLGGGLVGFALILLILQLRHDGWKRQDKARSYSK